MLSLNANLYSAGISAANGLDLAMQRDQFRATLRGPSGGGQTNQDSQAGQQASQNAASSGSDASSASRAVAAQKLTAEQQRQVANLREIDRRVHAHEQAHLAAGAGVVTGGANYTYTYGPDGNRYAVGGEVGIDTSAEKKPQQNIDKGERIQAAALAPMDPSPQDYRVAAVGAQLEAQGRIDLAREQAQERAAPTAEAQQQPQEATAATSAANSSPTTGTPAGGNASGNGRAMQAAYAALGGGASTNRFSAFA